VLAGGDDHALVATFPPGTALPDRWQVIGDVADPGDGEPGPRGRTAAERVRVTVDGQPWDGPGGWQHF
jgi:thiamine-monophosphate kinase